MSCLNSKTEDRSIVQLMLDGRDPRLTEGYIRKCARELRGLREIVVTGVDSSVGHSAAMSIAAACTGRLVVAPDLRNGLHYAKIWPSPEVAQPKTLPHPERPDSVPAKLRVDPPDAVANDYRAHVWHARLVAMPSVPVSVIIPVYNRREMLGRTLACLTHQTYPRELIEVIVADDGSSDRPDEVLESFRQDFGRIRYVRQEDQGYRLAAVRNLGIRAATHENLILLDCDMAPVPRFVELHVRHLEAFPNALYVGHRRYVDANGVSVEAVRTSVRPMLELPDIETANEQMGRSGASRLTDWRLPIYAKTGDLCFDAYPFRAVAGGNLSFTKSAYWIVGEFDEEFTDWGGEDGEWAYRAWNRGLYIVPLIDACGLHQEPIGGDNETDREAGRARTSPILVDRCPVGFRPESNRGGFSVPLVSIYIPAYNAEATIIDAVQSALNQTVRDLEVCVVNDGSTDQTLKLLVEHFGDEPRVRIADQKNSGIGRASNRAVRMCRGVFIGQLDADDLLRNDAVELMLEPMLRDTRIGVAYGSHVKIDSGGETIGDAWVEKQFSRYRLLHIMIVHHFRLFRARDWYRTAGFAEDLENAVDLDLYLKMSEVTEMVHVDERVYSYRIHEASTSQRNQAMQYRNHATVVARALERRGLAADWIMEPLNPDDARRYRFVSTGAADRRFCLDVAHIRISGGNPNLSARISRLFPTWTLKGVSNVEGHGVLSPRLSERRAHRYAEMLRAALNDANVMVESCG